MPIAETGGRTYDGASWLQPIAPPSRLGFRASSVLVRFAVHYFLLFTVMATVYPYFQIFLRARGFTASQVGYLQGLLALAGVCGPVLIGRAADRLGSRRMLIVACWAVAGLLLIPLGTGGGFWIAAALVVGIGLTVRTPIPLTDALVADALADPVHQYGQVRTWGSIGFVLSLLCIRVFGLVDESSAPSMLRAMLIALGICTVSSLTLREHRAAAKPTDHTPTRRGHFDVAFWLFIAAAATHQLGMSAYYSFFTMYLHDSLGMEHAAWVWALGTAAEVPMLFFAGRVIQRFGLVAMLVASMSAVTVRLTAYALAPMAGVVLPGQVLHAMTFGLFHAASIEFLRRKAPPGSRALAMALYMSLSIALPGWLGSSLGGIIVEHWGYSALYLLYAAFPLAGVAILIASGIRTDGAPCQGAGSGLDSADG